MSDKKRFRLFTDDGKHLDRFGLVFGLSAASVAILSLIDLDDPTATSRSELGFILVTIVVGITLMVVVRASGVARLPRIIADVSVGLVMIGVVLSTMAAFLLELETSAASRQPFLWTLVALISPMLVLRRVMMQRVITVQTLFGALGVYLLLALAFNYAYLGLNVGGSDVFFGHPESTSSFMYFSLVTITTVGYGDLAPVGDVGRFLATAEAVLGQVLLVTVVARLVSIYSTSPQPVADSNGKGDAVTVE